jgi:hypothetical protein
MSTCKKCQSCVVTKNGFVLQRNGIVVKHVAIISSSAMGESTQKLRSSVSLQSFYIRLEKRLMGLLPSCLMYHQAQFRNSLHAKQNCCLNLKFQSTLMNWDLMRCGISSGQKEQAMDSQSSFSCNRETRCTSYRRS